ncbi:hypothetical protein C0J52_10215 [Blattella germanica]|nr:hypothetical protein C0J52_10215 [Blattella germanica]
MAATLDIRQKQRAVIEFLCCENETVGNIHKRLKRVYGAAAVDWASRLRDERGHANIRDNPHTAQTPDNVQRVNDLVLADKRITDDDSLVNAAKLWLRRAGPDFYRAGIQALVPRWHKAVERDGIMWKNEMLFLKHVSIHCKNRKVVG